MKVWKDLSNSIRSILAVINHITAGLDELSLMFKDTCTAARLEQQLEAKAELTKLQDALK